MPLAACDDAAARYDLERRRLNRRTVAGRCLRSVSETPAAAASHRDVLRLGGDEDDVAVLRDVHVGLVG